MIALALLAAASAKVPLGVFGSWGAFREGARCYAIAAPPRPDRRAIRAPFASVASRFGRDRRNAIFVRLSRNRAAGVPVTLSIGERRFVLSASVTAAWAPDAATDRAIVAAMRGGRSMSIETAAARGAFADSYALAGAATAIDAAALACRG